ncbi:MAG: efflux RND transporter periplasmic adaptor subunit [Calditrichaeota bacterium]|nr:efflux RND transporter periplasmic adaptor subunit [Calditrichota bacterium]MCB0268800.1 efflux RND transporter periplasmic adaptor subunit [Calditrichota bacterium]
MTIHRAIFPQMLKTLITVMMLAIAALFFTGCSGQSGSPEKATSLVVPAVEAVQSKTGSLPLIQRLNGVVKAKNQVSIYPEINAVVVEVLVKNGDTVKRGQPLIRLRDKEFRERLQQAKAGYQIAVAQARQAEARLNEIQSELTRSTSLANQGLISTAEMEQIQTQSISAEADLQLANARVAQAKATVQEREESLSQTVIRSPVSGRVGNRNAEIGMLVSGSNRLFTVGELDNVLVEMVLTDHMLNYIEEGQRAEIDNQSSSADGLMAAKLSRISPFLHPVSHTTEAEIDIANPDGQLKPGMFVTVDIFYGESDQATLIPLSALYENPATGETGVYVSRTKLERTPENVGEIKNRQEIPLTDPVDFQFVPVEVVAKGRMEAGIRGVDPGNWVITMGQNLLAGNSGVARVRPVDWQWVAKLQHIQRQDLMEDVINRKKSAETDTASISGQTHTSP